MNDIQKTDGDGDSLMRRLRTAPSPVAAWLQQMLAAWKRRRQAGATAWALQGLDARALRDIGLDRSEVGSVASELAGIADHHRRLRPDFPH